MFDNGFFGGLFDFNGDGKLSTVERVADYAAFVDLTKKEKTKDSEKKNNEGEK